MRQLTFCQQQALVNSLLQSDPDFNVVELYKATDVYKYLFDIFGMKVIEPWIPFSTNVGVLNALYSKEAFLKIYNSIEVTHPLFNHNKTTLLYTAHKVALCEIDGSTIDNFDVATIAETALVLLKMSCMKHEKAYISDILEKQIPMFPSTMSLHIDSIYRLKDDDSPLLSEVNSIGNLVLSILHLLRLFIVDRGLK